MLRKALRLAVKSLENHKVAGDYEIEEVNEQRYERLERETCRWKRKCTQMEKHHEEAEFLAKELSTEVKQLREQVRAYILLPRYILHHSLSLIV